MGELIFIMIIFGLGFLIGRVTAPKKLKLKKLEQGLLHITTDKKRKLNMRLMLIESGN